MYTLIFFSPIERGFNSQLSFVYVCKCLYVCTFNVLYNVHADPSLNTRVFKVAPKVKAYLDRASDLI